MERINELVEYLEEYRIERTKTKKGYMGRNITKLEQTFYNKLNFVINEQVQRQKEESQDKAKYLFLCRLISSGFTGSYEAIIGICSSSLYLDEKKSQTYWYPEIIYENMDLDMKKVKEILQKKFIRLEDYELLHIKQKLIYDDWNLLQDSFQKMIHSSISLITSSPLLLDKDFTVLFGDYMDELQVIGHVNAEGRDTNEQ